MRELLTESEILLTRLKGPVATPDASLEQLLSNLDRMAELWPALEATGADLRPEAGRWETLQASLRSSASQVLSRPKAVREVRSARARLHPEGKAAWWWYLPEARSAEARRRVLRAAAIAVGVVALLVGVAFLVSKLFPVDPRLRAALSKQTSGQQKIEQRGDYIGALADFQEVVSLTPEDPDGWLWLGATQKKLGDEAGASASFSRARSLARDEIDFRLARIPVLFAIGLLEDAGADVQVVLEMDPGNPQALYLLASILESQQKYLEAAAALQQAAENAEKRNMVELTALSRYRLGIMLQQLQVRAVERPTPSPTP